MFNNGVGEYIGATVRTLFTNVELGDESLCVKSIGLPLFLQRKSGTFAVPLFFY